MVMMLIFSWKKISCICYPCILSVLGVIFETISLALFLSSSNIAFTRISCIYLDSYKRALSNSKARTPIQDRVCADKGGTLFAAASIIILIFHVMY